MKSKKILSALLVSSLVVPSISTNLASANSVEHEPVVPNVLTDDSRDALAKKILENGNFSSEVVVESENIGVPSGFTPISNFSYNGGDIVTPFALDPGGSVYWDGFYGINSQVPVWVVSAGVAYIVTWAADKWKLPSKVTNALLGATAVAASQEIIIKGTIYYKLISLTKAEYYADTALYINGKLINTASGSWTATVDTNID